MVDTDACYNVFDKAGSKIHFRFTFKLSKLLSLQSSARFKITFSNFSILTINLMCRRSDICPVQSLLEYFARCGLCDDPLLLNTRWASTSMPTGLFYRLFSANLSDVRYVSTPRSRTRPERVLARYFTV